MPIAWIKDHVRRHSRTRIEIVMAMFLTISGIALLALDSLHRKRLELMLIFSIYGFAWLALELLNGRKRRRR